MNVADLPERIAVKLNVNPTTQCWEWGGTRNSKGDDHGRYGQVRWQGDKVYVHRLAYHLLVDPTFPLWPGKGGIQLDHTCFVKHCANPAHLEPVTNRENSRRSMAARGRRSHVLPLLEQFGPMTASEIATALGTSIDSAAGSCYEQRKAGNVVVVGRRGKAFVYAAAVTSLAVAA